MPLAWPCLQNLLGVSVPRSFPYVHSNPLLPLGLGGPLPLATMFLAYGSAHSLQIQSCTTPLSSLFCDPLLDFFAPLPLPFAPIVERKTEKTIQRLRHREQRHGWTTIWGEREWVVSPAPILVLYPMEYKSQLSRHRSWSHRH